MFSRLLASFVVIVLIAVPPVFAGPRVVEDTEEVPELQYLPVNEKFLLTHDELRQLNPEARAQYIETLREFYVALEGAGVMTAQQDNAWLNRRFAAEGAARLNLGALLLGALRRVEAAEPPKVIKPVNGACPVGYTGDGGMGNCVLVSTTARQGQACPPGSIAHSQKNPNGRTLCYQQSTFDAYNKNNGSLPMTNDAAGAQSGVRSVGDSIGAPAVGAQGPALAKVEPATDYHPMTAPPQERAANASADSPVTRSHRQSEEESMRAYESNEEINDKLYKKNLACIYAGFPIRGKECSPRKSYVSPKSKTAYTCLDAAEYKKSDEGSKASKVVAPKKFDEKKTVLCNPAIFGLNKDKEPFCVARGKKATANCKSLSSAAGVKEQALKDAAEIMKDDDNFTLQTNWTIQRLCSGKEDVNSNLKERGYTEAKIRESVKDLKATCQTYSERFAEFQQAGYRVPSATRSGSGGSGNGGAGTTGQQ